jgi:acyl-CoA reductase-like NAD-dependent aldehyde dehydrogenase
LVVNSGDLGDADVGAMTASFQLDIVQQQIDDAISKGATVLVGGATLDAQSEEQRGYVCPTLLTNVSADMSVMREETFGPVIVLLPFDNQNEVIEKINATEFGLSASVWSKDLERADTVARALEVGAVSINNVMLTEGNPALPFGGCKQSGFGRVKGAEGLRSMVRSKAIIVDKQSAKIEANWYPYTRVKYKIFDQFIQALSSIGWRKWIGFARFGIRLESLSQKRRDEL